MSWCPDDRIRRGDPRHNTYKTPELISTTFLPVGEHEGLSALERRKRDVLFRRILDNAACLQKILLCRL